jgi:hypothetical protein
MFLIQTIKRLAKGLPEIPNGGWRDGYCIWGHGLWNYFAQENSTSRFLNDDRLIRGNPTYEATHPDNT